jgi:hypothetical protein
VIKFIFGIKDIIKAYRDMKVCGVHEHLWLKRDPHNLGKIFELLTSYVLKVEELNIFLARLRSLTIPSDYYDVLGKHIWTRSWGP